MAQAGNGWAAHFSSAALERELQQIESEREQAHRKLTRKARRTPRHVLQQRRPSAVTIVHVTN